MRTANPALNAKTFTKIGNLDDTSGVMTIKGTVNKTFLLLFLVMISAGWMWNRFMGVGVESAGTLYPWLIGSAIGGLVLALITIFNKKGAYVTAPLYALIEGVFLGGISAIVEMAYPGIVLQAVSLTFGTLFCLLLAYKSGWIKATENFKLGVVAATGGIAMIYLVTFILGFFGVSVGFIHGNGLMAIGFSVFVIIIAALNLVLDFDFIEQGAEQKVPKYMEWYAAFGLMVTLIWLYLEILRLLVKLASRR